MKNIYFKVFYGRSFCFDASGVLNLLTFSAQHFRLDRVARTMCVALNRRENSAVFYKRKETRMNGQGIPYPPKAIRRISPKEFNLLFNGTDTLSHHTFHRVSFADEDIVLSNQVFRHCIFLGCDFAGKRLEDVWFDSCELRCAQFSATNLDDVTYSQCRMDRADFEVSSMRSTKFFYNDMSGVCLSNALIDDCMFDFCRMVAANLVLARFRDVYFKNSLVPLCNFSGVKFDKIPGKIALEILYLNAKTSERTDFVRSIGIRGGELMFPPVHKETRYLFDWANEILRGYTLEEKE